MRKSFLTDWLQTFLTEAFITILGIIILKLFAHLLVEADFGVYLILRRSIMLLMPVVSLNLSLSLARFINLNKVNGEVNYLKSIRIITFLALLFLIISIAFKSEISFILFNSHDYTSLIIPLVILTYVTSIHWIATGYFRGNQKFSQMNLLLIVYWLVTIFGMSILIWIPTSETIFLSVYFYLCSGILFLYNLYMMKSILITRLSREKIRQILLGEKITSDFKKIINYGLKRLPQGFLLSILFFLPLVISSNYLSLADAAYMGIVISIIRIMQIVVQPFNQLFVPKFSNLVQLNKTNMIRYYSQVVVEFFFSLPLLAGIFVYLFSSEIITIWFGYKYYKVSLYLMIAAPSIGFYLIYVLIRGILDGLYDFPYTNVITFISTLTTLGSLVISSIYFRNLFAFTISLVIGLIILGSVSIYILMRRQKIKLFSFQNIMNFVWICIIAVFTYFIKSYFETESIINTVILKLGVIIIILISSIYIYYRLNMNWLKEINLRIVAGGK